MKKYHFLSTIIMMLFLNLSTCRIHAAPLDIEYEYFSDGYYDIQSYTYEYGTRKGSVTGNYDGYLKITDSSTQMPINTIIYDIGNWEFFVYLAEMETDKIAVVCKVYNEAFDYELPVYKKTVVILYDLQGNYVMEKAYSDKFIEFANHGKLLILQKYDGSNTYLNNMLRPIINLNPGGEYQNEFAYQFQGDAFINETRQENIDLSYPGNYYIRIVDGTYEFSFTVILNVSIEGVSEDEICSGPVQINTLGKLWLNGDAYSPGSLVERPGNYELQITGEGSYVRVVRFVIYPLIDNVSEGMKITNGVRIFSNGEQMEINGEKYGGDLIFQAGAYILDVYGINNFKCTLRFWILPEVSGIEDEETYLGWAEIWTNAKASINSDEINEYIKIETPGDYVLTLYFEDNEYAVYHFRVFANASEEKKTIDYNLVIYVLTALAVGGLIIIFKKK